MNNKINLKNEINYVFNFAKKTCEDIDYIILYNVIETSLNKGINSAKFWIYENPLIDFGEELCDERESPENWSVKIDSELYLSMVPIYDDIYKIGNSLLYGVNNYQNLISEKWNFSNEVDKIYNTYLNKIPESLKIKLIKSIDYYQNNNFNDAYIKNYVAKDQLTYLISTSLFHGLHISKNNNTRNVLHTLTLLKKNLLIKENYMKMVFLNDIKTLTNNRILNAIFLIKEEFNIKAINSEVYYSNQLELENYIRWNIEKSKAIKIPSKEQQQINNKKLINKITTMFSNYDKSKNIEDDKIHKEKLKVFLYEFLNNKSKWYL